MTFSRDTTTDTVTRMEELLARAREADADLARVRVGARPAGEADPYRESGSAAEPLIAGGLSDFLEIEARRHRC